MDNALTKDQRQVLKLAIFDLDGTLVDSSPDILIAANAVLKFFGHPAVSLDTIKKHIGEGFGPFVKHVAGIRADDPVFAREIFDRFQYYYDQKLIENTAFYEGAENFIRDAFAQGQKVGIASNKPAYQVRRIMVELGFSEADFVAIYGGDSFDVKKPNPKQLLEIMRLADVNPEETVMIGDSKADVEAAQEAGTHFVAVSFGYNHVDKLKTLGANFFIDHYDDLPEVLQTLTRKN